MTVSKEILDIFHKWGENLSNIEFLEELREQIIKEHYSALLKDRIKPLIPSASFPFPAVPNGEDEE